MHYEPVELQPFRARPVFIGDHDADEHAASECGIDFIRYPDLSWPEIAEKVVGP